MQLWTSVSSVREQKFYGEVHNSVIGPNVIIGKGSVIRDSIIMKNTAVGENVVMDKAIVAEDVVIGNNVVIGCRRGGTECSETGCIFLWTCGYRRKQRDSGQCQNR